MVARVTGALVFGNPVNQLMGALLFPRCRLKYFFPRQRNWDDFSDKSGSVLSRRGSLSKLSIIVKKQTIMLQPTENTHQQRGGHKLYTVYCIPYAYCILHRFPRLAWDLRFTFLQRSGIGCRAVQPRKSCVRSFLGLLLSRGSTPNLPQS